MTAELRHKYNLQVPVHTVMNILCQFDLAGVRARHQHRLVRRTVAKDYLFGC